MKIELQAHGDTIYALAESLRAMAKQFEANPLNDKWLTKAFDGPDDMAIISAVVVQQEGEE